MSETTEQIKEVEETPTSVLKKRANSIVTRRTIYAAGAGLIPFPLVDVAALLGVQIIMIRDISRVYEVDFAETRVRSIITTLLGDLGTAGVMSGIKAIPIVGTVVGAFSGALTGAAATYALGKVFIQHFDQGGTLLDFDPVTSRKYFQDSYEEGKIFVEDLSETDDEVKEKRNWKGLFKKKETPAPAASEADLAELRRKNEEMKAMIAQLQRSVDALKNT